MNVKSIDILEIEGIKIGHAQDFDGGTGCTAIICPAGAVAGADIRGGGPASRETELLKPVNMVQEIHCVMLSGGSAYGLSAGDGAMRFLEERGVGFDVGVGLVPIVCGASLFDLVVGDPKSRPDADMGYAACSNAYAGLQLSEGNAGAGTGASVGKFLGIERMMKGGIGIYCAQVGDIKCGAVVAVNALGDVIDYDGGEKIAGLLNENKDGYYSTCDAMYEQMQHIKNVFTGNTTIGCVVTNAKLSKDQCNKLASVSHNGFARTISPVHTSADGDTIFVMATGQNEVAADSLGVLATEVVGRAINRAVRTARPAYGLPAACDFI